MRAVVVLLVVAVVAGVEEGEVEDPCVKFVTCDGCAQGPGCVWCLDDTNDNVQCKSANQKSSCKQQDIINADVSPENMKKIVTDEPFTTIIDRSKPTVQLRPQAITITARPGQTVPFQLSYRPAKDYPLDVYYLIDFSSSMKQFITKMKEQGIKIYNHLKKMTNNVHMGIGSFIEKPALPYSSKYMKTYSFKNHLKLQEITVDANFKEILNKAETQGNFDNPEAGLDALLQVMVCRDELKWRNSTTRLILFITDDMYHSAGDGKMVGAYRPHDGNCYVDEAGVYSEAKSLELDYPSVPYLNYIAKQQDFTIIFVVAERVMPEYDALAKSFANAKAQKLSYEGDDVINLIESVYLNMTNQLKLGTFGENNKLFELSFDRDCRFENAEQCKVEHHSTLEINAKLKVHSCPIEGSQIQNIIIQPHGTRDKLNIKLKIVCDCNAFKQKIPPEGNSTKCHYNGTLDLGTCLCNSGRSGKHCECDSALEGKLFEDRCKDQNSDVCSGQGVCECGQCIKCTPPYTGRYCECNQNAPECMPAEPDAPACWGHGTCGCKPTACKCNEHYDGAHCHHYCDPSRQKCQHVFADQECSGAGTCICGECDCHGNAAGRHCEQSPESTFLRDTCARLQPCVTCRRDADDGGDAAGCAANCTITTAVASARATDGTPARGTQANDTRTVEIKQVRFLETEEYEGANEQTGYTECRTLMTDASCHILFKFSDHDIIVQKALDCTAQEKIMLTVIGVIVGIVVVGLLTLLAWKLLTNMHDRREFARFQKEMQNSDWGENTNPIYNAATTTISNPAYKE